MLRNNKTSMVQYSGTAVHTSNDVSSLTLNKQSTDRANLALLDSFTVKYTELDDYIGEVYNRLIQLQTLASSLTEYIEGLRKKLISDLEEIADQLTEIGVDKTSEIEKIRKLLEEAEDDLGNLKDEIDTTIEELECTTSDGTCQDGTPEEPEEPEEPCNESGGCEYGGGECTIGNEESGGEDPCDYHPDGSWPCDDSCKDTFTCPGCYGSTIEETHCQDGKRETCTQCNVDNDKCSPCVGATVSSCEDSITSDGCIDNRDGVFCNGRLNSSGHCGTDLSKDSCESSISYTNCFGSANPYTVSCNSDSITDGTCDETTSCRTFIYNCGTGNYTCYGSNSIDGDNAHSCTGLADSYGYQCTPSDSQTFGCTGSGDDHITAWCTGTLTYDPSCVNVACAADVAVSDACDQGASTDTLTTDQPCTAGNTDQEKETTTENYCETDGQKVCTGGASTEATEETCDQSGPNIPETVSKKCGASASLGENACGTPYSSCGNTSACGGDFGDAAGCGRDEGGGEAWDAAKCGDASACSNTEACGTAHTQATCGESECGEVAPCSEGGGCDYNPSTPCGEGSNCGTCDGCITVCATGNCGACHSCLTCDGHSGCPTYSPSAGCDYNSACAWGQGCTYYP